MRIGHLGSYNINFGDNIALWNVRRYLDYNHDIEWVSIDIRKNFWKHKNSVKKCKKFFNDSNFDAIIVGGGGLIECIGYQDMETGYKLPFNAEIFDFINCPVAFIGLGVNVFRGREGFSDQAIEALSQTIECSSFFSVRNDGSRKLLENYGMDTGKLYEIPDPGIMIDPKLEKDDNDGQEFFQPAFNKSHHVNRERFVNDNNIDDIYSFVNNNQMICIPHSIKDFRKFSNFVFYKSEFKNKVKFKNTHKFCLAYKKCSRVVAMRGHGQMVTIGMRIPGIYLSTQDKVEKFSEINGFSNYNVDIREDNWLKKLKHKYEMLKHDEEYLNKWYKIRDNNMSNWRVDFDRCFKVCAEKCL